MSDNLKRALQKQQGQWKPEPSLLLCPQIPKPLHGVNPRTILGTKWWNETRKQAYASTLYHCLACGVYKLDAMFRRWLEGHEIYEVDYVAGRLYYIKTAPLCHACHNYIHRGRLDALLEKGEVSQVKYVKIVQHGDEVLASAGLKPAMVYNGPAASWSDWRLILEGKEYAPKFRTMNEWLVGHGYIEEE